MNQKTLTKADLAHFTGSEQWYRHGLARNVLYTEGGKYVAEYGRVYWLINNALLKETPIRHSLKAEKIRGLSS